MAVSYLNLIKTLKKLRTKNDLTQRELAQKAGVSQAHIAKIENGKVDPRLSTLKKLFSVLKRSGKKCEDIMTKDLISVSPDRKIKNVINKMKEYDISQIPVIKESKVIGNLTEKKIVSHFKKGLGSKQVKEIMGKGPPIVPAKSSIEAIKPLLEDYQAVLVRKNKEVTGIISRADLLRAI